MWYVPLLPCSVEHSPSQIGIMTTWPWRLDDDTASSTFFAQSLPVSTATSTGKSGNWIDDGLVTSSSQLLFGSRSRIMNAPPPVLHRGTRYSWPTGWGSPGLLIRHGASTGASEPLPSQFFIVTGNTTGMNTPPVSAPATAVASLEAVNWFMPRTRANVVSNTWLPATRTPWVVGGIVPT